MRPGRVERTSWEIGFKFPHERMPTWPAILDGLEDLADDFLLACGESLEPVPAGSLIAGVLKKTTLCF